MINRSKLVSLTLRNIGCIGNEGLRVALDNVVCLVGKNNAGKSTVLRAYELVQKPSLFDPKLDRCMWAPKDAPSEVELEVHIPDGISNVGKEWKAAVGDLLIVRSIWIWEPESAGYVRKTWSPEAGGWSDTNAAGLDNVFKARLPRPLRIGSLEDANDTQELLLTLALKPLLEKIEAERITKDSALATACGDVIKQITSLSAVHEDYFNEISNKVSKGFRGVFPQLDVRLHVGVAPLTTNLSSLVKSASELFVKEGKNDTTLSQQGTGARRALFWAMLQVHNQLKRTGEEREAHRKALAAELAAAKKKKQDTADIEAKIAAFNDNGPIPEDADDPAFPGYLLLIDEPENALHPMAARAAQQHLYQLACDPDWQVMMTTHSPYFINPLEDHTTIVRLERASDEEGAPITPRTYRSDAIEFEDDEKKRLQALQHIDPSLSEVFFGSYPILVEGDTEHAAFLAAIIEKRHELREYVTIVRARGKAILPSLVAVMRHFKIDFGIVHDCDPPFNKNGDKSAMWSENNRIREAVLAARACKVTVRHRVSIPDFERWLGCEEGSKDKPLTAYRNVTDNDDLSARVQALLDDLLKGAQHEPFPPEVLPVGADYLAVLYTPLMVWATANGAHEKLRFKGKV